MDKIRKILWLDDDIDNASLRTEKTELSSRGYTIVGLSTPDDFDKAIKENVEFDCFIIDVSLPVGSRLDIGEAKKGLRTGLVLLKEIANMDKFSNVPIIVYTIVSDHEIKTYCREHNIIYIDKGNASPWTLLEEINNYEQQREKKQAGI